MKNNRAGYSTVNLQHPCCRLLLGMSLVLVAATLPAADLHQAEPGEIVIIRKVTAQPHNRINQNGPIMAKADLRSNGEVNVAAQDRVGQQLQTIRIISLSDTEAAVIRSTPAPGNHVRHLFGVTNANLRGTDNNSHGNGRILSHSHDISGQMMQQLGGGHGSAGGVGGALNNLSDTLGSVMAPLKQTR